MRPLSLAFAVLCGLAAACATNIAESTLPFYDSADFTPRWVRSVSHRIAPFELVDHTGAPFTRDTIGNRIHIASFVFTRCEGICPTMMQRLARVQSALGEKQDVVIVSFSVDPQHDTSEHLAAYATAHEIDAARWKLVTGDASTITRLARDSYFADDRRLDQSRATSEQLLHTEKLLLVDRDGRLRGVYNGTLAYEIDKLLADIRTLEPLNP